MRRLMPLLLETDYTTVLNGEKTVYLPLTGLWASKFTAVHVVRGSQGGGGPGG